jgi:putative lipoic acid-binding regulatory protein
VSESLLNFPCRMPIKVFGKNEPNFRAAAIEIVRAHCGVELSVAEQPSRQGTYLSLTIVVHAASKVQLDALYHALVESDSILMAL